MEDAKNPGSTRNVRNTRNTKMEDRGTPRWRIEEHQEPWEHWEHQEHTPMQIP
jgi:hypothetical protein